MMNIRIGSRAFVSQLGGQLSFEEIVKEDGACEFTPSNEKYDEFAKNYQDFIIDVITTVCRLHRDKIKPGLRFHVEIEDAGRGFFSSSFEEVA